MGTARAVALTAAMTAASLVGIPLQWIALRTSASASRRIPWLYHRLLNRIIGVRRTVVGTPAAGRPLLLLANHVSWLDITVLSAVTPLSFVAKSEIAGWPVFGLFAKLQRSIFVERAKRQATGGTTAEMAERLSAGDVLVLFAEGTSSDHNRVLPFRTALLGATREALASERHETIWLQPVSLAYTRWNGLPMGRVERPRVAWYGDMDLAPHLWRVLKDGWIDVVVAFGEPIAVDASADRKSLARTAEQEVRRMTLAAQRG